METHVLTVLTHLWFAAEIAPVEEQKGFTKRLTTPVYVLEQAHYISVKPDCRHLQGGYHRRVTS